MPDTHDTQQSDGEQLTHVGWWCWRGDNHGHLATQPCRSDNVPIHAPAEWADEMRTVIQQIEDGDEDDTAPAPAGVAPATDQTELRDRIAEAMKRAPFKELRADWNAPNGPLQITARIDDLTDAVLAVLPDTSRTAVLREAADAVAALREETCTNVAVYPVYDGGQRLALSNAETRLRRLAGEAQQQTDTETPAHTSRSEEAGT